MATPEATARGPATVPRYRGTCGDTRPIAGLVMHRRYSRQPDGTAGNALRLRRQCRQPDSGGHRNHPPTARCGARLHRPGRLGRHPVAGTGTSSRAKKLMARRPRRWTNIQPSTSDVARSGEPRCLRFSLSWQNACDTRKVSFRRLRRKPDEGFRRCRARSQWPHRTPMIPPQGKCGHAPDAPVQRNCWV